MLRQILVAGERAYQNGGIGQAIAYTRRLEDVLDEVNALEKLQPAAAAALGEDLARVRETMTRIASRLGNDEKLSTFAADVLAKLDGLKPASVSPLAAAPPAKDLSPGERMELVRLELAAARTQVDIVLATNPKNVDEAARVCAPLKGHLDEARNAAFGIDRSTRGPLFADVDQVSRELDAVERSLTMDPRFAWHSAFAGAFDAENRLRSTVGLPARARAYSGKVDPTAAAEQVLKELQVSGTGKESRVDAATATPQELVVHVGLNIASTYERMHNAMTAFKDDFAVEDPPTLSIGDILVNASVAFLLDVATAGVASFVGNALGKVLTVPAAAAAKETVHEAEELVVEGNVIPMTMASVATNEAVRNASANDAIRSRVTGIMKGATTKAQITPPHPSAPTLLNHFVANAIARITDGKLDSTKLIVSLGQALSQLDPSALRALNEEMLERINDPATAMYDRAVVEFEKLRTANALAQKQDSGDPRLDAKHVGNWRDEDIAGVLEVGLHVSASNQVTFDHLRLQGGEPAAREWLRRTKQPLRSLGLHRIFNVRFESALPAPGLASVFHGRDYVTFGVGAKGGLQLETLDEKEWLWLRLFAADRSVHDLNALALAVSDHDGGIGATPEQAAEHLRHQMEMKISRDAAVAKVRSLIMFGDTLTTDKVEP